MSQLLFDVPSFILGSLAVAIAMRAIWDATLGSDAPGLPGRALRGITEPILRIVRSLAPKIVPTGLIYLFALCWLMAARMVWLIVGAALGLRTSFGA